MPDDMTDFERDSGPGKPAAGPQDAGSDWLRMPEADAAKRAIKLWHAQDHLMKPRKEHWKANRARRAGVSNVQVVEERDTKTVKVWVPPGPQMPVLNKAGRLCRRVAAFLFADPPLPEASPSRDDDEAREGAEFSTRVLRDLGAESQLDDALHARQAFDLASTYDSGFVRFWVNATGGGRQPIEITANEAVGTLFEALTNPGPPPHIKRYVTQAGELTEEREREDLRFQWIPKLECEILTGKHVRFLPATARDIWAAEGVLVATMIPLGQLKALFPKIAEMSDEELARLTKGAGAEDTDLLPASQRRFQRVGGGERNKDDTLVFVLTLYYLDSPRRPGGLCLVAAGKDVLLDRRPWRDDGEPENTLDLPITQYKQFEDEDEPYGAGLMRGLGPGNELRNAQIGTFLEHLDRFLNRKVFYPITSTFQSKQAQDSMGVHIPINPGGEPRYEEVPDFPRAAEKFLDFVTADMDDESSLQQVGQALNPPSVKSGLHAQQITEQVIAGLSDLRQNTVRALTRGWRIQLQLVRAFYTVPQQMSWQGEDGEYKRRIWTASDLGSTRDVRLHKGSFTQLTPAAKAAVAQHLYELGVLTPEELEHVAIAQVGGQLALQDNPHRMRVRRQIARWVDGPPEDWQPPAPQQDPQTGEEVPGEDPALAEIFDPRPVDELPNVAAIRLTELARLMSSTRFARWPAEWQQGVLQAFERARQAAGVQTASEQAQAAEQQQQAAEEMQRAEQETGIKEKEIDREAKVEAAKITSEGEIEEEKIKAEARLQEQAMQVMQGGGRE